MCCDSLNSKLVQIYLSRLFHRSIASSRVRQIFVLAPQTLHSQTCFLELKNIGSTIEPEPQNGQNFNSIYLIRFDILDFSKSDDDPENIFCYGLSLEKFKKEIG